jgi:hypothetical protein
MGSMGIRAWCLGLAVFVAVWLGGMGPAKAQSQDLQQLLLDMEKLTHFKAILGDMQQGYAILSQGYGQVKDLAQGNFSVHQVFLDGLLAVNPEVARYGRVADIVLDEASILSEYRKAYARFQGSGRFSVSELDYLGKVYAQLTSAALQDINDLADVLTASRLRMSDDERLSAIDRIYRDTEGHLVFLRNFNRKVGVLQLQRQKESDEVLNLQNLFGK